MVAVVQDGQGTGNEFNANNENGLVIAGKTGVGLSQRMQSFVLDPAEKTIVHIPSVNARSRSSEP